MVRYYIKKMSLNLYGILRVMTEQTDRFADRLAKQLTKKPTRKASPAAAQLFDDESALAEALENAPDQDVQAPLFVELEGSLVRERSVRYLVRLGWGQLGGLVKSALCLPLGRGRFKQALARNIEFDPAKLPYNESFLEWLWGERESDRPIWLLTSADEVYAKKIANYLGLFDGVIASNEKRSLRGDAKLAMIRKRFSHRDPFDYCGCAYADLNVFAGARNAILVGTTKEVQRHTVSQGNVSLVFD
jgi:hypothetical protein